MAGTSFDEKRVELAKRIAENENVTLQEAFRRVPSTKPELDALVARLNSRHGGPGSPDDRKIGRAMRRAKATGESFTEAARRTK